MRFLDYGGALFFAVLAGVRLAQVMQNWMLLPLLAQAGLAAMFLILRRHPVKESPVWQRLLAWFCALLPMAFNTNTGNLWLEMLSFLGLSLSLWALISLGRSFGIAPADRLLVTTGPYAVVRHPMYLGEVISYLAILISSVTLVNLIILLVVAIGLIIRIYFEEEIVDGYEAYSKEVRYKLVPFVW